MLFDLIYMTEIIYHYRNWKMEKMRKKNKISPNTPQLPTQATLSVFLFSIFALSFRSHTEPVFYRHFKHLPTLSQTE